MYWFNVNHRVTQCHAVTDDNMNYEIPHFDSEEAKLYFQQLELIVQCRHQQHHLPVLRSKNRTSSENTSQDNKTKTSLQHNHQCQLYIVPSDQVLTENKSPVVRCGGHVLKKCPFKSFFLIFFSELVYFGAFKVVILQVIDSVNCPGDFLQHCSVHHVINLQQPIVF